MSRAVFDPDVFAGTTRFQVLRLLGQGGVGVVYEALDREQNAHVALKMLRVVSPEALLRFKQEFRVMHDLDHANLVRLGELIEEAGTWFFTMELVKGTDLLSFVRLGGSEVHDAASTPTRSRASTSAPTSVSPPPSPAATTTAAGKTSARLAAPPLSPAPGLADYDTADTMSSMATPPPGPVAPPEPGPRPFSETRLRHAFTQLAEGLDALHRADLVHRDVKPSNVLVDSDGRVVILDFGLASAVADVSDEGVIGMGTLPFMAPEQWMGAVPQPPSDWYAVGVALYQALTGSLPFGGKDRRELAWKKLHSVPPPPSEFCAVPPDLEELCMALLARVPSERPSGAEVVRRLGEASRRESSPPESSRRAQKASSSSMFIGRERELAELSSALADSRSSGTVAVLVTGDSGMGKSMLVRRFRDSAVAEHLDTLVLAGRCHERESVPYKAVDGVVDALSRHLSRLPAHEVVALLPADIGALGQVFPVLRQIETLAILEHPDPLLDRMDLRRRAFGALRELLVRVAEREPLVMLIDDLQWADSDSLALLDEVLRRPGPRLLLVATQRGPATTRLRLGELEARRIHVAALPDDEAQQLAMRYLGEVGAASAEVAEAVAREAAGHPLFIAELVQHLGAGRNASIGAAEVAPAQLRLDDALRLRIARLEEPTRRALELVAIAGVPLPQAFLAEVAEQSFAEFARHVATLRAGRLLRSSGARPADRAEPYHDRISEALRAGMPAEVARGWHERLARALDPLPGSAPELLSVHWAGAGDPRRAAEHAIRAAEQAARTLAFERSARLYRRALELFESIDGSQTYRLEVTLAGALVNAGRSREAADVYARAATRAPAHEALDLRRRAGEAYLVSGHVEEGMATMTALLEQVGMRLPRTRAGTLLSIGMSRVQLKLRGFGYRIVEESDLAPELLLKMDTAWAAGLGLGFVDAIQSTWFTQRFLLLSLRTGERLRLIRGLVGEASFLAAGGTRTAARTAAILARIDALAVNVNRPYERGWIACIGSLCAYLEGRFTDVVELAESALPDLERAGLSSSWELDTLRTMLINGQFMTGRTREMIERSQQFMRAARDRGDHYEGTLLRTGIPSYARLLRGEVATARRMAEEAVAGWSKRGTIVHTFMDLAAQAAIDLYEDPDGAAAWRRMTAGWDSLRAAHMLQYQMGRVNCLELRGRATVAAARRASPSQARSLRRAAAKDVAALGREESPPAAPLAGIVQAALEHQRGDGESAARSLRAAAERFAANGMTLHEQVARRRLGELLGGDEGRALVESASAWMVAGAIAEPARITAMLAPGFGGAGGS